MCERERERENHTLSCFSFPSRPDSAARSPASHTHRCYTHAQTPSAVKKKKKVSNKTQLAECTGVCVCPHRAWGTTAGRRGNTSERTWRTRCRSRGGRCRRTRSGWSRRRGNWWGRANTHLLVLRVQNKEKWAFIFPLHCCRILWCDKTRLSRYVGHSLFSFCILKRHVSGRL